MKLRLMLVPIILTLAMLITVTSLYPLSDDFHPMNPHWNGMERVAVNLGAPSLRLAEASTVDPLNYTLLIVGPSLPFSPEDVEAVKEFLFKGGRVILADEYGSANQLLEELGVPIRIIQGALMDPIFNLGSPQLPLARWNTRRVALNYAAALDVSNCVGCKVLAESSFFSYLDLNFNGSYDEGELRGPLPVAASINYGVGELTVIADSSLFVNSLLDRGDNAKILTELLGSTRPAIVVDHWSPNMLTDAKALLADIYRLMQSPELKYTLALLLLLIMFKVGQHLLRGR